MEELLRAIPALRAAAMLGPTAVKDALLAAIARLTPVEVVTYDELVPGEGVRLRQYPDVPLVAPILPVFSACLHTHPIMPAFFRHGAEPPKSSDYATLTQFRDTAVYSEVYRGLGVDHQLYLYPQGPQFQNVSVTLNRHRRDFAETDREFLRHLAPHFEQAWRNARALEDGRDRQSLIRAAGAASDQEVVFLTAEGTPEAVPEGAAHWLAAFFPGEAVGGGLPDRLRRWVHERQSEAQQDHRLYAASEPLTVVTPEARLKVRWFQDGAGRQMLLLAQEVSLFSRKVLTRARLTAREGEVLRWIAEGKTDSEMGMILGVSEHTAHKHAQNILGKLGATNRAGVLLRLCELAGRA